MRLLTLPLLAALLVALWPATLRAQAGTDQMELIFEVNDSVALRLSQPVIKLGLEGVDPVLLADDGSVADDLPGDHIWSGYAVTRRMPKLAFHLVDEATGQDYGEMDVFLPAADEARLVMRTTEGDPPLMMGSEDGVSVSADGSVPGSGVASGGSTSAPTGGGERFSYLLWVVLLLGLLGFGYLRVVVRRIYLEDFLPTWKKLDAWLERELKG